MDAALNFGAQLGGFLQKDVKPETGAIAPGRRIEGYEGSPKRDGEAREFLAAIRDQSAAAKDDTVVNAFTSDDAEALLFKLQFQSSAALTIDDPDGESSEPQSKASAPFISSEIESTQYKLRDQASVPTITDANGGEQDGLESGLSTSIVTGNAKSEIGAPLLEAFAPVVVNDTDIKVTEQQVGAFAQLTTGDTKNELRELQPRASAPVAIGSTDSELRELQPRASAPVAIGSTDSELREQKPRASVPLAVGDTKNELPELQSSTSAPLAVGDVETTTYESQPRITAPTVFNDSEDAVLVFAGNSQVERSQISELTVNRELIVNSRAVTDDPASPRRQALPGAKAAVVQGSEILPLQKTQPTSLEGVQQLAPPDAERSVAEDIRIPEKQTQPSATLNDPSRVVQSRQTSPYFLAPADHAVSSALIVKNGEGVSSDLDLDMAVDFTSGRRLVGQAVSAPQTLASPITTHAPVVGATAQIIAAIKANRRSDTIEIRLDPPELGRVKIDFTMETMDSVKAVLSAERAETLDHMRRNIGELAAQLKEAGFKSMEFEFSKNTGHEFSKTNVAPETSNTDGGDASSLGQEDIVYLSMRSDAQLDLLA
ncbi:MAG: hypothetical protein GXP04_02555 [Alphaproteobacteria bacterium]|nr:hypothetical protein [Alphaproteobacteria bacterium]